MSELYIKSLMWHIPIPIYKTSFWKFRKRKKRQWSTSLNFFLVKMLWKILQNFPLKPSRKTFFIVFCCIFKIFRKIFHKMKKLFYMNFWRKVVTWSDWSMAWNRPTIIIERHFWKKLFLLLAKNGINWVLRYS